MDENLPVPEDSEATDSKKRKVETDPLINSSKDFEMAEKKEMDEKFEKDKELFMKNYTPVNPDELKFPNTDPVFVRKTWADKPLPVEFEAKLSELLNNMKLENTMFVNVQCHGSLEKYVQTNIKNYGEKTITTISGAINEQPLFATSPDGCIGIFPAPLSAINYASGNYKNAGVGYFLNPANNNQIFNAVKTGNIDKLFQYIANRETDPEYSTYGLGVPECCPNYLLDFNPGVDTWAAFVATSEANPRNLRSLMETKDTRTRTVFVSSSTEKMEESLLNNKYRLFGETPQAIAAEIEFKKKISENDSKIFVGDFFEIIKRGFPDKTIICFFDVCSAFVPNLIGTVYDPQSNSETILTLPIDQKLNKDKFNIKDMINGDPFFIELFQQYLTACAKFKPIRIPTIYRGIRFAGLDRPTFDIEYSPIVEIALKMTKKMFDAVKISYVKCAVKDPSFRMGEMVKIQIDSELVFASKLTDKGEAISDSQPQDLDYLISLNPTDRPALAPVTCKPREVFADITQFVRNLLFKRQPGCFSMVKYTLKPGERNPIRDDDGPFASSSSASGGGGGPVFRPSFASGGPIRRPQPEERIVATNQELSPEELRLQRKGGSRKIKKNKTKIRKTKKITTRKTKKTKARRTRKSRR